MNISIHQDKFHRIILKAYRVKKIVKEEQTLRNLLCYYQELACDKYPDEASFSYVLGYLYDAKFKVRLTTYGSYSIIEYSLAAVEPKYINDPEYTKEALLNLFNDACNARCIDNNFDEELFNRAYEIYESDLLSREDSFQSLALRGLIKEYFKGTLRDYNGFGNLEDLSKITTKDLYNYYLSVLKEEYISIMSCSDKEYINNENITLTPKTNYHFHERNNTKKELFVSADSSQCYLEVIYETKTFANDKLYMPIVFLNYLFGGAPSSFLFKIVREKYGLCYSINSMYLGASGIIVVSTILDKKDIDKAIEGLDEALEEILNDNYDIEEVRKYYISNNKANRDIQENDIANYLSDNYFLDSPKSSDEISSINKVTKEDIKACATLLERTFVYAYGGDEVE